MVRYIVIGKKKLKTKMTLDDFQEYIDQAYELGYIDGSKKNVRSRPVITFKRQVNYMAVRHVKEYYNKVCDQYHDMLNEIRDFEEEAKKGLIEPERLDEIKKNIQPLINN